MLCRDADACYWIGRYVERAEATARMVDVHYHAALEGPLHGAAASAGATAETNRLRWQSLLSISGSEREFELKGGALDDRELLDFFTFDEDNANSIRCCWRKARENARSIREQLSSEMWESMNVAYLEFIQWDVDRLFESGPHAYFETVKNASHLFQGILNRTMMMGETRDWLDVGRFLERANQTARLLDVKYHDLLTDALSRRAAASDAAAPESIDMHGWIAVLKSVSAFEMYRKTYQDGIKPASVVDFLVLNVQFPASVRHGVGRVESCLRRISGNQREEPSTEPERMLGRLHADLTYTRPEEIIADGLHPFLEGVQERLNAVGSAISRAYLA